MKALDNRFYVKFIQLEIGLFANQISNQVRDIFSLCLEDPSGALNEPLTYEEVGDVCSRLKQGVSGVSIDNEHIRYAGPPLWEFLFQLYQQLFVDFSHTCQLFQKYRHDI